LKSCFVKDISVKKGNTFLLLLKITHNISNGLTYCNKNDQNVSTFSKLETSDWLVRESAVDLKVSEQIFLELKNYFDNFIQV